MHRVFIPIDGSAHATKAVGFISKLMGERGDLEVHVANIVGSLAVWQDDILDEKSMEKEQVERAYRALAPTLQILDGANIRYHAHVGQGDAAKVLMGMAERLKCDFIVMGVRPPESKGGHDMGPVARNLLRLSKVSVICVK